MVSESHAARARAEARCCASGAALAFRRQRLRIDARAQALVALLRHELRRKAAEPLEAESLALTLVRRSLGRARRTRPGAAPGRQRWSIAPSWC